MYGIVEFREILALSTLGRLDITSYSKLIEFCVTVLSGQVG